MSEVPKRPSLPTATLNDVAESIVDGPFGSNLKTSDYVESGVPVLQGKNITGNRFVWKEVRYISEEKAEQLMRSSTVLGDHLLIKIGSIGYSAILDNLNGHPFAIIPANLARIRPDRSVVDDQYLHRVLTSDFVSRHFQKVASKTAQPALSLKKIKATAIPLPPLAEQKRLAGILDAADALRAKRRESLAQLDSLLQSTFLDMFGDPMTNPMGWEEHSIDSVFEVARGGSPRPIDAYLTESEDGLNWIMIGDAVEGSRYISSTKKRIKPEGLKRSRMVHEGDFLLTNSMSFGKPYILKTEGCIHDGWLVLSPKDKRVSADFFYSLLSTGALYREFKKRAAGAVVKNLNTKLVKQVSVPVPPLDLQHRFATIVESVEKQRAIQRAHLAELDTLFASLQSRAFCGDL